MWCKAPKGGSFGGAGVLWPPIGVELIIAKIPRVK